MVRVTLPRLQNQATHLKLQVGPGLSDISRARLYPHKPERSGWSPAGTDRRASDSGPITLTSGPWPRMPDPMSESLSPSVTVLQRHCKAVTGVWVMAGRSRGHGFGIGLGLGGPCGIRQEPLAGCGASLAGVRRGGGERRGLRPVRGPVAVGGRPLPPAGSLTESEVHGPGLCGCSAWSNTGCEPV